MKCETVNKKQIIEKYILNRLSNKEKMKFEEHYFECQSCSDDLLYTSKLINSIRIGTANGLFKRKEVLAEDIRLLMQENEALRFWGIYAYIRKLLKFSVTIAKGLRQRFVDMELAFSTPANKNISQHKSNLYVEKEVYIIQRNSSQFDYIIKTLIVTLDLDYPVTFTFSQ